MTTFLGVAITKIKKVPVKISISSGFIFVILFSCSRNYELSEDAVFSPEKTKYVDFYDDRPDNIQLLLGFEKTITHTAGGIFSIRANKADLNIEWTGEENLWIEYPAQKKVYLKEDSIGSFGEQVMIHYRIYQYCEVIESKTIGMMDTTTAMVTVQFPDNQPHRQVSLIGEDKKAISLPMKKEKEYGGIHISEGNYKIQVQAREKKCYSNLLSFNSGEIKLISLTGD